MLAGSAINVTERSLNSIKSPCLIRDKLAIFWAIYPISHRTRISWQETEKGKLERPLQRQLEKRVNQEAF